MIEEKIKLKNSITLNVQHTEGQTEKPTVLLLHFSGGTSHMWDGVIPYLLQEYRIIAPDLRGHGKSDRPATGYHIDDFANDLYLLLEELKIQGCHVVCSSMGAEVGLSLAASHPELVLSLVCEGALHNEYGEYGLFNGTPDEIEAEKDRLIAQLDERKLKTYQTLSDFIEDYRAPLEKEVLWNEHFQAFIESCIEELPEGSLEHFYKNHVRTEYILKYLDVRFEEYYQKTSCPILFLPSEEEWTNPKIRHSLDYFSSLTSKFKIQRIEGSVHAYVWMQFPRKGAEVVNTFIKDL
ncbi:alpha/beta fold hydrolase [Neobacillus niacini]|uniref:alpha/beta hydrolase n=1 Tax=Neobacillus niacini TaxID=86668 RepID=UPI0021CB214D|nr:alpha/beta hydrolase [Neobacillus niacini]MCM3767686.1 alpha/beta hydrolase [Neobacillus niacini]